MKNKKSFIIAILLILSLMLVTIGVTVTFFVYKATGTTTSTITTGGITFHYKEENGKGHGISITDAAPVSSNNDAKSSNDYFEFKITSTTTSGMNVPYIVTARMNNGSDSIMGNIINIYLTEVNGNNETPTTLFSGDLVKYNELDQYENIEGYTEKIIYRHKVTTTPYEKTFRLRMWIDENTNLNTGNGTSNYNNKTFSITVNVNATGKLESNKDLLKDLILEDNIIAKSQPTLTTTSQEANEKGLYKMSVTNGFGGANGDTYYFRGNVTNNVVEFADLTWRVIRINEDGTVRLILDSGINNNETYAYNNEYTNHEYMYYSNNSDYIKSIIDNWYTTNITGADASKVAIGNYFCEAAKVKVSDTYTSEYATMELYANYIPDLKCLEDGNNKQYINEPVGLINFDEVVLAGGRYGSSNQSYYLYKNANNENNSFYTWTMSPAGVYINGSSLVWDITDSGSLYDLNIDSHFAIRPVINLKANTTATKNNQGHYVVD